MDATRRHVAYCAECGTRSAGGRFCSSCGSALVTPRAGFAPREDRATVLLPVVPRQHDRGVPAPEADTSQPPSHEDLLPFDDELPSWPEPRRRRTALVATAAAMIAVTVVGGALLARHLDGADTRRALSSSGPEYDRVLVALTAADDAELLAQAAETARPAASRIEAALRRLGTPDGHHERVIAAQLAAETAVLTALAGLVDVDDEPVSTWGSSSAPIAAAVDAERRTRAALAGVTAEAARALPDAGRMLERVTATVGAALAAQATEESLSLVAALQAAQTTAELRAAGDGATADVAAVRTAAAALDGAPAEPVLVAYGDVLDAVSDLARIDGDSLRSWKGLRAGLAQGFGALASAAPGDPAAARLRGAVAPALGSVDALVKNGEARVADWKAAHAAAVEQRADDLEELGYYVDGVQAQVKGYQQMRTDLSAFFTRVEDPNVAVTYDEAFTFLSAALRDRRAVRDTLNAGSIPAEVQNEHDALVAVVDRAVTAVQAAYDGSEQAYACEQFCFYRHTPGWARFQSESTQISKDYAAAVESWRAAAALAQATISKRALPAKPEV